MGPTGENGIDGGNEINRKTPQIVMSAEYSNIINSFKQFVKINLSKIH